jgi:acyl-CoA dehydrogenase
VIRRYDLDATTSPSRYARYEAGRGLNYYDADDNLRAVLGLHLDEATAGWAGEPLRALGERCGTVIVERADTYDRVGHELERYDRLGRDVSRIAYHPDWLANLDEVFDFGLVGWNADPGRLGRYGRAPVPLVTAFDYLVGQADMALCCPVELAHGTVVVLERYASDELRERLLPGVVATSADRRLQTAQVATEITGGSDVGGSQTEARCEDGRWYLSGEKWFASNIGADLIVTLGRVDADIAGVHGLGMFVVPRIRADGSLNGLSIRRLKDKLGTIGVPTGELLLDNAEAYLLGDADRGFRYMAEMLNHTRYWNAVGSLGVMRRAFLEAAVYTARRATFGTTLDAFPMVRERLIWLLVDLAATTSLVFATAAHLEAHDTARDDAAAHLRLRTLAPVVKYRSGEQNVDFARAAIELLGANGYVNTFGTPRLLRDAQVNPIWEGTSNICALDLWRAVTKSDGHEAVLDDAARYLGAVKTDAGTRLADVARRAFDDVRAAVAALRNASAERQQQQARRFADLFGDAVALAALAREADHEARAGDWRKALVGELFAARSAAAFDRLGVVVDAFHDLPEVYPDLFAAGSLAEEDYLRARKLVADR